MGNELNGKRTYLETVKYMGDLRIVGQVVESIQSKSAVGYIIMTEKTKKMQAYTSEQTKWLLSKYKFSNAKLEKDKIVNIECAMNRLMKFNMQMSPLETNKAMIIGKILLDGKTIGFRVLTPKGNIVDLKDIEVLDLHIRGIELVNAKIVDKTGSKPYISAIKQEFAVIEKTEIKNKIDSKNKNKRYTRKVEKIIETANNLRECLLNLQFRLEYNVPTGKIKLNNKKWEQQNKAKIIGIIVKDCMSMYHGNNIPEDKKQLASRIVNAYKEGKLTALASRGKLSPYSQADIAILLLSQLITEDIVIEPSKKSVNKHKLWINKHGDLYINTLVFRLKKLDELNLLTQNSKSSIIKLIDKLRGVETGVSLKEKDKSLIDYAKFDVDVEFRNSETLYNLGISISKESKRGTIIDTASGHKLVRYLVDYIPEYKKYLKKATCLGDLVILAKIEIILKYPGYTRSKYISRNTGSPYYYYPDEESKVLKDIKYVEYEDGKVKDTQFALAEMLLAILAIYRPDLAAEYKADKAEIYSEFEYMLPGIDLSVNTDFGLSKFVETLYKSGLFMLELEDNKFIDMRRKAINNRSKREIMLIQDSPGYKAVKNELSSVISMITSENCDNNTINNKLLNLNIL